MHVSNLYTAILFFFKFTAKCNSGFFQKGLVRKNIADQKTAKVTPNLSQLIKIQCDINLRYLLRGERHYQVKFMTSELPKNQHQKYCIRVMFEKTRIQKREKSKVGESCWNTYLTINLFFYMMSDEMLPIAYNDGQIMRKEDQSFLNLIPNPRNLNQLNFLFLAPNILRFIIAYALVEFHYI